MHRQLKQFSALNFASCSAEDLMYARVERGLGQGWKLYRGARVLKVNGMPFPNQ